MQFTPDNSIQEERLLLVEKMSADEILTKVWDVKRWTCIFMCITVIRLFIFYREHCISKWKG